jgi:gluconate 2-dehydrogenase gamma chain
MNYIDKQIYQRFQGEKQNYSEGVKAINSYCRNTYQKVFVNLSWDEQTQVLQLMEAYKLPEEDWGKIGQQHFFNLVRRHTMQGYYGAPHHGGNKDYISFRMMKLDYPLLVGQNRYGK